MIRFSIEVGYPTRGELKREDLVLYIMDHGRKKIEKMETLHLRKGSLKKKPVFFRQA